MTLAKFSDAFCDSLEVLEQAWAAGLPRSARIRTSSPALAMAGFAPLESDPARIGAYWDDGKALTIALFEAAKGIGLPQERALMTARAGLRAHRIFAKALFLTEDDFHQPRLALMADTGNSDGNALLNPAWHSILSANPDFTVASFPAGRGKSAALPPPPSLSYRLRLFNLAGLGTKVLERFWTRFDCRKGRPRVLIARENELLVEAAFAIGRSGALLRTLGKPPKVEAEPMAIDQLIAATHPAIEAFGARWYCPSAGPGFAAAFREGVQQVASEYGMALPGYRKLLAAEKSRGPSVIVTNFPGTPAMTAMVSAAREAAIPVVAFQHGVTREICANHGTTSVNYENGVADLFLCYNQAAVDVSDGSPFRFGRSVAVGMPAIFNRLGLFSRQNRQHPILYVNTAVPAGNVNMLSGGVSDIDRTRREIALIDNVLGRLPHGVLYKTYPARDRYTDPDPIPMAARVHANMGVFDRPVDLRYMIGEHRLIITARASSTTSWCMMANRPLIFLDIPDHAPFRPEVREAFAEGNFLFPWEGTTEPEGLVDFLSRPIEEIEKEWKAKAPARQRFRERYLSMAQGRAGVRAAAIIRELVSRP